MPALLAAKDASAFGHDPWNLGLQDCRVSGEELRRTIHDLVIATDKVERKVMPLEAQAQWPPSVGSP